MPQAHHPTLIRPAYGAPWVSSALDSALPARLPGPLRIQAAVPPGQLNLLALAAAVVAARGALVATGDGVLAWAGGEEPPAEPSRHLGAARRVGAVLLDRDGTIIQNHDYLADSAQVRLLPGVRDAIQAFNAVGLPVAVLTNQSGVARGLIPPGALEQIHARLREELRAGGARVDGIWYCPHGPEHACDCRKPAAGMAHQAAAALGLDLRAAVMAGDSDPDLGLARGLGIPGFLVLTGAGRKTLESGAVPADYCIEGLEDLARICIHPAGVPWPLPPSEGRSP